MGENLSKIMSEIKKGVAEMIDEERIENLVKNYYEKGENFYVKAGFDPTAPDLHLGHSVVLQKMAFLQKHGAIVQFLIGHSSSFLYPKNLNPKPILDTKNYHPSCHSRKSVSF
ncbi:MAG: hypothetical protein ACFNUU_08145 [Campylobacter sp.]|uniref:hypothetical protein n=1 Tax=Campylobacter sp. TaxID=205 RepID=UPI0036238A8C